jgi:hypothetical protein
MLTALLGALGGEDPLEALEVLDGGGCQKHVCLLSVLGAGLGADVEASIWRGRSRHIGRMPYAVFTSSCSKAHSVAAARLRTPAFS